MVGAEEGSDERIVTEWTSDERERDRERGVVLSLQTKLARAIIIKLHDYSFFLHAKTSMHILPPPLRETASLLPSAAIQPTFTSSPCSLSSSKTHFAVQVPSFAPASSDQTVEIRIA